MQPWPSPPASGSGRSATASDSATRSGSGSARAVGDGLGDAVGLGDALSLGDAEGLGTTGMPEPSTNVPLPPSAVVSVSSALAITHVVTFASSWAKIVPYDPSGQATSVLARA